MKFKYYVRLYGAGGHSKVVKEVLTLLNLGVSKIYDDSIISKSNKNIEPGLIANNNSIDHDEEALIIAVGDNVIRKDIAFKLKTRYESIVHPHAIIASDVTVGIGSVVFAGAIIQSNTKVGNHVIINTAASIDHDNTIEDFVHISPNVTLSGNVTIKEGTHVGSGAIIIPNIKVGKWCIIGAGAVIIGDVPDYCTVVGNPGKIIKRRKIKVETVKGSENPNIEAESKNFDLQVLSLNRKEDFEKYLRVYNEVFKSNPYYSPYYFGHHKNVENEIIVFKLEYNGNVLAVMPMVTRIIDQNFDSTKTYKDVISPYGYNGPLFVEDISLKQRKVFWQMVDNRYRENNIVSEFVRFSLNENHLAYSGEIHSTLNNVVGDLSLDFEDIWNSFRPKVRNNYRYGLKNNLHFEIKVANEINDSEIRNFYDIYIDTMKRLRASELYFFSLKYFKDLLYNNIEKFAIAFTYLDTQPIATELLILNKKWVYAHLGGTLKDFLSYRSTDFLRVEIIKWAKAEKNKFYVLGGGRKENDSLYSSKKTFFPKSQDLIYFTGRKIILPDVFNKLNNKKLNDIIVKFDEIKISFFPPYRYKNKS